MISYVCVISPDFAKALQGQAEETLIQIHINADYNTTVRARETEIGRDSDGETERELVKKGTKTSVKVNGYGCGGGGFSRVGQRRGGVGEACIAEIGGAHV